MILKGKTWKIVRPTFRLLQIICEIPLITILSYKTWKMMNMRIFAFCLVSVEIIHLSHFNNEYFRLAFLF